MTLASASDRSPTGCTSWRDTYRIQNSNPLAFATSQMRRLSTELASNPCTPGSDNSSRQRHLAPPVNMFRAACTFSDRWTGQRVFYNYRFNGNTNSTLAWPDLGL